MNDTPEANNTSTEAPAQNGASSPNVLRSITSDQRFSTRDLAERLDGFGDVRVQAKALLGKVHIPIEQFLKLTRGSVLALDRHKTEAIDLVINEMPIAKVDITVIHDAIGIEVISVQKPSIIEPIL